MSLSEESRVAFFAYITDHLHNLGELQDIVFDHAVTNIGDGYNQNHGVFVAPIAGTYVLTATLVSGGGSNTWGHFVVNGVTLAKFDLHNENNEQSTQTVIVDMYAGDDVSVQSTKLGGGISGDRYSSFSGFLLYPADDTTEIIG
mgnify:CR=1 FL=1